MKIQVLLLNSVLPAFITGLGGFYTAISILSRKEKNKEKISFAFSWLLMGSVFFLVAVRLIAFALGMAQLDRNIFYIIEVCTGLAIAPMSYHIILKTTKKENLSKLFSLIFGLSGLLFIFLVFIDGVEGPKVLISGSEYSTSPRAMLFFAVPSLIGLMILIFDLIKRGLVFSKERPLFKRNQFLSSFSFFLFIVTAGIDHMSLGTGWSLTIIRIALMISALIASISYPSLEE
ncbi:MAG: hypothetical protein GF370_01030 [Candidatus Nealsonbacteria bacterium]|nr:hypothetical protein [Candidatus Nealsonbacteria bacterium]